MPDLDNLKNKIKEMEAAVRARLPDIAEAVTLAAKGIAERNIKREGFGEVYSQAKVPAWFLHGKELNQKGTKFLQDRGVQPDGTQGAAKKKRRKKGEGDPAPFSTLTNWGEFRNAQGLQNMYVDLSYFNKMWANMQPVKVETDGDIARAFLGATNKEAQNKMNWNRDRYGDFIRKGIRTEDGAVLLQVVEDEIFKTLEPFKH